MNGSPSLRIKGNDFGIRFSSYCKSEGVYGTLIAKRSVAESFDSFTLEDMRNSGAVYYNVSAALGVKIKPDQYDFSAAITRIREDNYDVEFTARAYAKYTHFDGKNSFITVYSAYDAELHSASYAELITQLLEHDIENYRLAKVQIQNLMDVVKQ